MNNKKFEHHLLAATSLPNWLSPLLFVLVQVGILLGLVYRGGWIEPDSYAFFNRACLNGLEFNTPILSKIFFSELPCNIGLWFFAQVLLLGISIGVMGWALKKFFRAPDYAIWMIGLSVFVLQFFIAFEDDHLAFPFIMLLSWWYLSKPNFSKMVVILFSGILLSLLVWKGAVVPLSIVAVAGFHPILGLIEVILLRLEGTFSPDLNGLSTELTHGYGFFANLLPWAILYFYQDVKKEVWENKNLLYMSIIFLVISFLQAKWGLYTIIPLVPFIYKIFSGKPEILRKICTLGAIGLLVMPLAYLYFQPPQEQHWEIIQTAKKYQDNGKKVLNHWGVGRYFQFIGGTPSQAGGNAGFQDSNGEWYWLGPERPNCSTISYADLVYFQKCG